MILDEHTREEVTIIIKAGWSCFGRYKDIVPLEPEQYMSILTYHDKRE